MLVGRYSSGRYLGLTERPVVVSPEDLGARHGVPLLNPLVSAYRSIVRIRLQKAKSPRWRVVVLVVSGHRAGLSPLLMQSIRRLIRVLIASSIAVITTNTGVIDYSKKQKTRSRAGRRFVAKFARSVEHFVTCACWVGFFTTD